MVCVTCLLTWANVRERTLFAGWLLAERYESGPIKIMSLRLSSEQACLKSDDNIPVVGQLLTEEKHLMFAAVLGTVGTTLSTVSIIPHVVHTFRTKKPGGSAVAWTMGVTSSTTWFVYGLTSGDFMAGAAGIVTIPCGLLLAVWSTVNAFGNKAHARQAQSQAIGDHTTAHTSEHTAGHAIERVSVHGARHRPQAFRLHDSMGTGRPDRIRCMAQAIRQEQTV